MASVEIGGQRLAYTEYGSGPRLTILLHGLLFSQRMHDALARALADRGHRVVTLDLLGHGESARPTDKWRYSMPAFGDQVIALLDELDADEAVIAGTSLGANVALEAAVRAPERVRGLVVEMPVLDHALVGCALAFTPVMIALTAGEPVMRGVSRLTRLVPRRRLPWQADILLDLVRQAPGPSAAVLQGLFFDRIAPPRDERRAIAAPALVIGHQFDMVHPFSDAGMLADELPHAQLMQAHSLLELRVAPKRLTDEIGRFLDECWLPRAAQNRARAS
jgi:pimeloyl-ACP methyl ester carboxylesterase